MTARLISAMILITFLCFCSIFLVKIDASGGISTNNSFKSVELYNKGTIFYYQEKYDEAINAYDQAIGLNLRYKEAWFYKGLALESLGKNNEAIRVYDEVIKLDPNYEEAFIEKGIIFMKFLKYKDSIKQFDRALKINSNIAEAWYNKGLALYYLKDYEGSLIMYDKFLEINHKRSKNALVWNNKGIVLFNLRRYQEAIVAYEKAIELDPNFAWPYSNKGVALGYTGSKYSEVIKEYEKAIELDPKFECAWNNKGVALSYMGKYPEAIKAYENAIELNPKFELAWNNKGVILASIGKHEEAVVAYDQAISINPNHARTWYNKGLSLINLKRHYESIDAFNRALELSPDDKNAWSGKINAWRALNQSLRAAMAFSMTKRLDLDNWLKNSIYVIFLFIYGLIIVILRHFAQSEGCGAILPICTINFLNFITFCWMISGLFNFSALILLIALGLIIAVIIISLIALIGLPKNILKNELINYFKCLILGKSLFSKVIKALSIISIIGYAFISTAFYFRYYLTYEENMLLCLRITFLTILAMGIFATLPIMISSLSSTDISKDLRNILLILEFGFISINSIYLSLIFWILGFGEELLQISPLLLGVIIFLILFTSLLPYLIGWQKEKKFKELLLKKQLYFIDNLENILIRPTPRLYITRLIGFNYDLRAEKKFFDKEYISYNKYCSDSNSLHSDCLKLMDSAAGFIYSEFLERLQEEINEIIKLFLTSKDDTQIIETAKIYEDIYLKKKDELTGKINIEKSSKPILWVGLTFIITPLLSTVVSYISNLIGPSLVESIIIKLIPELIQFSGGVT